MLIIITDEHRPQTPPADIAYQASGSEPREPAEEGDVESQRQKSELPRHLRSGGIPRCVGANR